MIPFDFEYYRPSSIIEAVELYRTLQEQGKVPMYCAGGTEIITLGRIQYVKPGAVIDLKSVPECGVMAMEGDRLTIGACMTLTQVEAKNLFPLLSHTVRGIADQTARNKITIGGNLCANIYYREAVLPFLLADSHVVIAGPQGIRETSIHDVFQRQLRLQDGEFLVQVRTDRSYVTLPYMHRKKRQIGYIGYPIVTIAALKKDHRIFTAYSGVCPFPFRSESVDQWLNEDGIPLQARIERAIGELPAPLLEDVEASASYRRFVLEQTMADTVQHLERR